MEASEVGSDRSLTEQAARRRERILANRRKRLAVASGSAPEEVEEAARRDQQGAPGDAHLRLSGRVRQEAETQPTRAPVGANTAGTPSVETKLRRRLWLWSCGYAVVSWEIVLGLAAVLCGFGAWAQLHDLDSSLPLKASSLSPPVVFLTLEVSALGSALLQRQLERRSRHWLAHSWWLLTRLHRWSLETALFFFLFFATILVLTTVETHLLQPL
ncbi:hypothetical protein CYME_CMO234C [Cyanidioschyzon merolae strain 10D]|jgi:hypothetical protein|uniref:Uncharacterized protein n=1 Tax=Cyanidioschyzon merolae (strain NIES-3377 / 10D) TaxID=280699 RepID=M1VF48_CYAM1|nr:hypothetical protein CYME_CMO234C [Cyanidioschyzon merolae strain 10D]BAM81582.1 hypothetical protein CYME_CMO234C [Cyanidioschyzon merolae strain 10D]|eukprot:XP_005537618.1 hypothetical protein CYME_CMO234C [Cyanidioschyzon merolae strain 10D]